MTAIRTIEPSALNELYEHNPKIVVFDVRTPAEYKGVHVRFAKLAPLESIQPEHLAKQYGLGKDSDIYFLCKSGSRAKTACKKFESEGYQNIYIVNGGVDAWECAGLDVVHGRKVISLERQVRIAAGIFVLSGLLLGLLIHPAFVVLSAFVGGGLVFSGITDTCGMGMLLARMPWNQAAGCTAGNCGS
jgi:rhodanese-related sulfurtransferase